MPAQYGISSVVPLTRTEATMLTITPTALGAGTTNNYAPVDAISATSFADAQVVRQATNAAGSIVSGLDAANIPDGYYVTFENLGPGPLTFADNTSSTSGNRFALPDNVSVTLRVDESIMFIYDGVASPRVFRPVGTPASSSGVFVSVKSYGATGDGVTDDTVAIQATITAVSAAGGGTIYMPNGTYLVSTVLGFGDKGCLHMASSCTLLGQSRTGTILKLKAGAPSFARPLSVNDADDVVIQNFTIDGNKANQSVEEHRAAIFTENCARVHIADMELRNNTGDGVLVHGNGIAFDWSEDVVMERCYMHDNDRKGVSLTGGGMRRITMRDCQFVNNYGSMHVEVQEIVYDVTVERCYCSPNADDSGYAISFGGGGPSASRNIGAYLIGCTVLGAVNVIWQTTVVIEGNRIMPQSTSDARPISIHFDVTDVVVRDNEIILPTNSDSLDSAISVEGALDGSYYQPDQILITGNRIRSQFSIGHAIALINAGDVVISNNMLINDLGGASSAGTGVNVSATLTALPTKHIIVANNYMFNWQFGVLTGGSTGGTAIASVIVVGNVIRLGGNPVPLGAYTFDYGGNAPLQKCAVTANEIDGYTTVFYTYPPCPILLSGTHGAGGVYSVTNTPEGALTEIVGAMALRRDGGASTTLYVKTSGTGNTGWTAK